MEGNTSDIAAPSQAQEPETLSLAGKVAIITGSGKKSGLGAGIVTALARNGAAVVINYLSDSTRPDAEALASHLQDSYTSKAVAVQADIETEEGAKMLVSEALKAFNAPNVHILVNNAGCNIPGSTLETPEKDIHMQFSKNVFGAINMVRAVVPHMPPGGRIINISSTAGRASYTSIPFYNAAKAGLDSLTHTWAGEFGRSHGITVNTVAPGPVATDELHKFARENPGGFKTIQGMIDETRAADRMGEVDDIADAVLLLVQEKSRWVTGQYIDCSGGITR